MNARQVASVLVVIGAAVLLFALAFPAFGQSGIVVNNADTVRNTSVSVSQGLIDSTSGVQPRIVMQYANTVRRLSLSAVPGALQTLLGQATPRIVFQYANTNRAIGLSAAPGALQTLLAQVSARIIFQYANTSRNKPLVYPAALIGDSTAPVLSSIASGPVAGGINISWTTDEFANSVVRYGTQPGVYTQTITDPLYVKGHAITLAGLTPGTTYYYRVRSTDQSGNIAESSERSFTATISLYLPLIKK